MAFKNNGPGGCCCNTCPKISTMNNVYIDCEITIDATYEQSVLNDIYLNPFDCTQRHDLWCDGVGDSIPDPPLTTELVCGRSFNFSTAYSFGKLNAVDVESGAWGQYTYYHWCSVSETYIMAYFTVFEFSSVDNPGYSYCFAEVRFGQESDVVNPVLTIKRCIGGTYYEYGETYLRAYYRSSLYLTDSVTSVTLNQITYGTGYDSRFRYGLATLPSSVTIYEV